MGLFGGGSRLKKWAKAAKNAIDWGTRTPPFCGNDVYFTWSDWANTITVHGAVYWSDSWTDHMGREHTCRLRDIENLLYENTKVWMSFDGLEGDPPKVKGWIRLKKKW